MLSVRFLDDVPDGYDEVTKVSAYALEFLSKDDVEEVIHDYIEQFDPSPTKGKRNHIMYIIKGMV